MSEAISKPENISLEIFIDQLQQRLTEAEDTLRAIRNGEIDALLVQGDTGEQIYTLKTADTLYRRFVEEMVQGAVTMTPQGLILYCNPRFGFFLGRPQEQIVGQMLVTFVNPAEQTAFENLLTSSNKGNSQGEINLIGAEEKLISFELALNPLWVDSSLVICVVATDLTEHKKAEETLRAAVHEKDILLKEVHHRVKNNLQVINSLLSLQSANLQDPQVIEIFRESQNRVRSMALIHENLYNSKDLSQVNLSSYIHQLAGRLFQTYNVLTEQVFLNLNIEEIQLDIEQAISCGLIINELITNSLKYAFRPGFKGQGIIAIEMRTQQENPSLICLEIHDNGVGLPANFDLKTSETLGFQIIQTLVRQLDGTIEATKADRAGTKVFISFPLP